MLADFLRLTIYIRLFDYSKTSEMRIHLEVNVLYLEFWGHQIV